MRFMLISALATAVLVISTPLATAADNGSSAAIAQNSGTAGITPAPGSSSTTGIGPGARVTTNPHLHPGNASRSGTVGTARSPRSLPGDDPLHPGFPEAVGK